MSLVSKKKMRGFTLIEVMIVVAIIGILSAIAIPNFMRFQARSKQSEAKTNLKALYTAQKAYFGEKDRYLNNFRTVGFEPEAGNRYSYGQIAGCTQVTAPANRRADLETGCLGQDESRFPTIPSDTRAPASDIGVLPTEEDCPECDFTATAIGNADNDPAADTWVVTSSALPIAATNGCGGDEVNNTAYEFSGGEPFNVFNDVTCDEND